MAQPDPGPLKKLEIKKYGNRRYYDATHSRHLTLDEIRGLIQQGYDIRVVDGKTSTDITAQVLTQIILELDTPKLNSFPVPLLVRLIRMNDQMTKDFIEKYFNQALQSFLDYQKQVEEQFRRAHALPSLFPSVAAWTKAILRPFATDGGPAATPPPPETQTPTTTADERPRRVKPKSAKAKRKRAAGQSRSKRKGQ